MSFLDFNRKYCYFFSDEKKCRFNDNGQFEIK